MATCAGQMMGLGKLSTDTNLVFKRKYRWTFSINSPVGYIPPNFVKLASRPNLTIEETEINYLHGKMWIPGKGTWETITVTYYDVGGPSSADTGKLYSWLNTIYNFQNPTCLSQSSRKGNGQSNPGYAGNAQLDLHDGCGNVMETWLLGNIWPQAINFGELDYSSSEEVTIELTLRYSEVEFHPFCGMVLPPASCVGC